MERPNTRLNPGSWSAAHPNEADNERWKGSPSTETTADQGDNARVAGEHRQDENTPVGAGRRKGRGRTGRPRRAATRH